MSVLAPVSDTVCELGESPVWNAADDSVYWVDITGGRLHRIRPASGAETRWDLGAPLAFAVPHEDGGLLLGRGVEIIHFDTETGVQTPLLRLDESSGVRLNDAKCDRAGRLWATTMDARPDVFSGSLYRVETDGGCEKLLAGIGVPNGPCWSPDDRWFYLADSRRAAITRYAFDARRGSLSAGAVCVSPPPTGRPDGAAMDVEGCFWSCQWDGWRIVRYSVRGEPLDRIDMPVARPTSCAFGGPDLRTLWITSARTDQPDSGKLFSVRTTVAGEAAGLCRIRLTG